jgi:putative transposase
LPKLGWIRFIDEFHVPKDVEFRNVTISTEGDRYYASICYKEPEKKVKQHKIIPSKTIGIDLGITTLATLSDDTKIENPHHLKKHEEEIKREQQTLSKKKEGTKAYEKQKARLNEAHRKVRNTRKDFLHKLTTSLVENQNWTSFCVEDLAVQDMIRDNSTSMSRTIGDVGWRMFRQMMEYKCVDAGKNLIVIGRFEPSSKACTCGFVNHALTLSDRKWTCPVCNIRHDRDILAANNIKRFGLRKQAGQSLLVARQP